MKCNFTDKQKTALAAAVRFFAVMLVITIAARAVNSAVIPTVETGHAFPAQITQKISSPVVLKAFGGESVLLPQGIFVEKVFFNSGESINEGECLAQLSLSDVKAQAALLSAEIKRMQTQLNALNKAKEPDTYALSQAQTALNEAYAAYTNAVQGADESEIAAALAAAQSAESVRNSALHAVQQAQSAYDEQASQNKADALVLSAELDSKKATLTELEAIINNEGQVIAPFSGTITSLSLVQGSDAPRSAAVISKQDTDLLLTGSDNSTLSGKISIGMEINVSQGKNNATCKVLNVRTEVSGETVFEASLNNAAFNAGSAQAEIVISKNAYNICVPVQSLRQDNIGTFVYTLEKRNTVLGESNVLVRIAVDVAESDNEFAALTGSISATDYIVKQAEKPLYEGSRVKLK